MENKPFIDINCPYVISGPIIIGRGKDLFLSGGNHNVLDFALGKSVVSKVSIDNLKVNLEYRRNIALKQDAIFAHIVAPEKWKVYPENFPVSNPISLADYYTQGGCEFYYPIDILRRDSMGRSYYWTDTHWSIFGIWQIVNFIADLSQIDIDLVSQRRIEIDDALKDDERLFFGDLGRKLENQRGEIRTSLRPKHRIDRFENGIGHDFNNPVNDGRLIVAISSHADAKGAILIFGDSYLYHAIDLLTYFFEKVIFCRTRFFHEEIFAMSQPNVVITQQAERYLSYVASDLSAPPFLMLPELLGRQPKYSRASAEAISQALSSGKKVNFLNFPHRDA